MPHHDDRPLNAERLLDRRTFLGEMGTGLGSIAFACLLAEAGRAAAIQNRTIRWPRARRTFPSRQNG